MVFWVFFPKKNWLLKVSKFTKKLLRKIASALKAARWDRLNRILQTSLEGKKY